MGRVSPYSGTDHPGKGGTQSAGGAAGTGTTLETASNWVGDALPSVAADTIQWNGTPVTLQQMEQYLVRTRSMKPEPELQFQPAPTAPYDTVNKALVSVKRSGITKFGFVGNEQYRVFGKAAREGR
jgi:hypothetical protein